MEKVESEPEYHRGKWSSQLESFLSVLGHAVSLSSVWRFPYLCYKNGGGAFLIPYITIMIFCGLPVFFLELSLGQYHGKGPIFIFKNIAPIAQGLGYAMLTISFMMSVYYNMVLGWAFFYLVESLTSHLKWEFCNNDWNSEGCFNHIQDSQCYQQNMTFWNKTCHNAMSMNPNKFHHHEVINESFVTEFISENFTSKSGVQLVLNDRISPSEDYFMNYMLRASPRFQIIDELQWNLVLSLFCAWAVIVGCLIKGIQSIGKVVYFTVIFPYVVLLILFVRGVTLEGALDGILFYVVPSWERLQHAQVWGDAAAQVFYSLGPGLGGLLTIASYNNYHNNCRRDAVVICIFNCTVSIFAGFVTFSALGFMAHSYNLPIESVVQSGTGLAFIAIPEAISKMPIPQLWSFLFFLMLITLGLDCQFSLCQTITTSMQDQWPKLLKWRSLVIIGVCCLCFILGLPLCTRSGIYLFTVLDAYAAGWSLQIVALLEIILIAWIYGARNHIDNVTHMINQDVSWYWEISWKYLSPLGIMGVLVTCWLNYSPLTYGKYILPWWANAIGWIISVMPILIIAIFMAFRITKGIMNKENTSALFQTTIEWGPSMNAEKGSSSINEVHQASSNMKATNNETNAYDNRGYVEHSKC